MQIQSWSVFKESNVDTELVVFQENNVDTELVSF